MMPPLPFWPIPASPTRPTRRQNLVLGAGGSLSPDGRLLFPPALVERVIDSLPGRITLCGRRPGPTSSLAGQPCIWAAAAPRHRSSTSRQAAIVTSVLTDIHDAARIVEQMDHIHFFSRPMVARDIEDPRRWS